MRGLVACTGGAAPGGDVPSGTMPGGDSTGGAVPMTVDEQVSLKLLLFFFIKLCFNLNESRKRGSSR
jgi:hypothetical protein